MTVRLDLSPARVNGPSWRVTGFHYPVSTSRVDFVLCVTLCQLKHIGPHMVYIICHYLREPLILYALFTCIDSSSYRSSGDFRLPELCAAAEVGDEVSGVVTVIARSSLGDRRLAGWGCWDEGGVTSSTERSWSIRYWCGDWRARWAQCSSSRCNRGRFAWHNQPTHTIYYQPFQGQSFTVIQRLGLFMIEFTRMWKKLQFITLHRNQFAVLVFY